MATNNAANYSPTQYNTQVGGANGTLVNVAPSATSGIPLVSNGSSSNPSFTTAVVAGGGTGDTTFTAYAPVCGGTTTTNPLQSASTGISTSGFILTSTGSSSLPSFQAPAASSISITGNTGGALTGNSFTFTGGTTGLSFGGSGTTETLSGTLVVSNGGTGLATLTAHDLIIGNGTTAVTLLAPSSTSGIPLVSAGASADPAYSTAVVAGGGTGATSFTVYAPLCGGTTTTGVVQSASTGISTSGFVLTSNGASALPSFQAAAAASPLVLLNTQTGSSSASLAFTSTYVTSTYKAYMITFNQLVPANNGVTFNMDWSVDNGSNYLGSNYLSGCNSNNYNSTTLSNTNSTTTCPIASGVSNAAGLGGFLYLFGLTTNKAYQTYTGQAQVPNSFFNIFGQNSGTQVINNIKFSFSSGNIASGTISLYGITQ